MSVAPQLPVETGPILSVSHLTIALPTGGDRVRAVENVSFDLARGEILCVIGESGSGKSVLASAVMGAVARGLSVTGGSVLFHGEDVVRMPEAKLRKLRGNQVAMVFQEPVASLNPAIRIGEQVEEVLLLHSEMSAKQRRARVLSLFRDTRLPDPERIFRSFPHQLSGGQCQRAVIAMALAMNPALLIADEPTSALDVSTQAQVLRLMRELRDEHRHGVLFITHDFGVVAEIADRVAVMQGGRMVEIGDARQVLEAPRHDYTRKLIDAVPRARPQRHSGAEQAGIPALQFVHLEKTFATHGHEVRALDDVSLSVPKGRTLGVVGELGSGKSTLAKVAIRLVPSDAGSVLVGGVDFSALSKGALRSARRKLQMIFQDPYGSLNPRHRIGGILTRAGRLGGRSQAEAKARAVELLQLVGLRPEAFHRRPFQFSGGQRQRIGIARALAMAPDVVLADECVSALDVSVQKQVLELLADLQARLGITLLFITHDLRVAAEVSDYIAVMQKGKVVEFGPADQVLVRPTHPYTQQLIAAAPGRNLQSDEAQRTRVESGTD